MPFPTRMAQLDELAPDELLELCRVVRAVLAFCSRLETDDARFDRDELGVDPEEDYEDEED